MLCPRCNQNPATLKVTEVTDFVGPGDPNNKVEEHHLCEVCAGQMGLPSAPKPAAPQMPQIWKLLQMAQQGFGPGGFGPGGLGLVGPKKGSTNMPGQGTAAEGQIPLSAQAMPACPTCGMNLEELRRRGRVGCEGCYDAFRGYLDESLERLHGATRHTGRLPGVPEGEIQRRQQVEGLRGELDLAVRDEDYERAASIRDEIQTLEGGEAPPT
jgi:protein arginine kinase activator